MAVWHGEIGRKPTGGKIHLARKKRKYELGSFPMHTKLGKEERKTVKTKGGGTKIKASSVEFVNVLNLKTSEMKKAKIITVVETPANPHLARRNIIIKGAIVKTEIGNARVTSRPSQHGVVNAILVGEKK